MLFIISDAFQDLPFYWIRSILVEQCGRLARQKMREALERRRDSIHNIYDVSAQRAKTAYFVLHCSISFECFLFWRHPNSGDSARLQWGAFFSFETIKDFSRCVKSTIWQFNEFEQTKAIIFFFFRGNSFAYIQRKCRRHVGLMSFSDSYICYKWHLIFLPYQPITLNYYLSNGNGDDQKNRQLRVS